MLRTIRTACGHIIDVIDLPGRNLLPHSITGPAFIYPDKKEEYYIYGIKYSKADWLALAKPAKIKPEEIAALDGE
jgi:hypothetical protein